MGLVFFSLISVSWIGRGYGFTVARTWRYPIQESSRETITKDRFVINSAINGWLGEILWDVNLVKEKTRCTGINAAVEIFQLVNGIDIRNGSAFTKAPSNSENSARSFSIIVDVKFKPSSINKRKFSTEGRNRLREKSAKAASRNVSSLDLPPVLQLIAIDVPNRFSEIGNEGGCDSGYQSTPMIRCLSNIPSRSEEYVVTVAILASCCYLAYLALRGNDPPPLKWSDLRYVFDIQEDCNGKEAIQA